MQRPRTFQVIIHFSFPVGVRQAETAQNPSEFNVILDLFDTSLKIPRDSFDGNLPPHLILMEITDLWKYIPDARIGAIMVIRASERSVGSWDNGRACQPTMEKKSLSPDAAVDCNLTQFASARK